MIELKYEELLEESKANNVYVIENADFKSSADGLINGNVIGINRKLQSFCKRTCTLAEELGHYHMTVGNIICQPTVSDRKQELRARAWAYHRLIGLNGILCWKPPNIWKLQKNFYWKHCNIIKENMADMLL